MLIGSILNNDIFRNVAIYIVFITFFVKIFTNHLISLFTCGIGTNDNKKSSIQIYQQKISLKSVGSMKGKRDIVLTDLMIKTYKVWRYRLNYVLSKYTQMTRTSPYVGSSHANIQLKNTTTTALHTACLALASSDCTMKPKYF